jgi:2,3-bisphosphoglycerate-dependent phosphoglycerate mutase
MITAMNSYRAMIQHLSGLSDHDSLHLMVLPNLPLIYELDENLKEVKKYFLVPEEEMKRRQEI